MRDPKECESCKAAEGNPHCGRFTAGCQGCAIRSIALGPQFHEAASAGLITASYAAALKRIPDTDTKAAHALVKACADKIAAKKGAR